MSRPAGPGRLAAMVVAALSLADPRTSLAQCAMCGAAAASSKGVARGLAFSIFFLLGTLFAVVAWLVVLVLRSRARAGAGVQAPVAGATPIGPARLAAGRGPAEK